MSDAWPFGDLPRNHFGVIYADPPWSWKSWGKMSGQRNGDAPKGDRATERHYGTLDEGDICSLPVAELVAPDCVLLMWATWPLMPQAFSVITAWGFQYKTCGFDWLKADVSTVDLFPDPKSADMKLGYWTRSNAEPCLLATRGKPKRLDAGVRMGIIEKAREHSRKPDCVYGRIERLVAGPYLELFARRPKRGWSAWGNETTKFGEVA